MMTATPPPNQNSRQHKRHYLIYYLRVFDRKTGEVLGHLVDLAEGGVMLMRDTPFEVGAAHEMRLRWRNSEGHLQVIDFEGLCRWCRPDVNPDFFAAGFAITTKAPEDVETIRGLIVDLGLPD
jgi:hypothetical protein